MNNQDLHILTIKQICPSAENIFKLDKGLIHDIYLVESDNSDKTIYRFSPQNTAIHNLYVSKLLNSYNIRVPNITLHQHEQWYCETYPFIQGKTLYERILEGISKEKTENVYHQLFDISCKIATIPYDCNIKPYTPFTSKISNYFCKIFNSSDVALCHIDLHARNVVLDNQDNVFALLDLDAIYPESLSFALINLIKDAQKHGCDTENLIKLCQESYIKPRFISIKNQSKIYSFVKNTAKCILTEPLVKQLLKIRV